MDISSNSRGGDFVGFDEDIGVEGEGDAYEWQLMHDGFLNVAIDAIDVVLVDDDVHEAPKSIDGEESDEVEQDPQVNASRSFVEVMAMEFDTPEEAVNFYDQYNMGKGFSSFL